LNQTDVLKSFSFIAQNQNQLPQLGQVVLVLHVVGPPDTDANSTSQYTLQFQRGYPGRKEGHTANFQLPARSTAMLLLTSGGQ